MKRLLFTFLTLALAISGFAQSGTSYTPAVFTGNREGDFHKWVYDQRSIPKGTNTRENPVVKMVFGFTIDETGQVKDVKTIETNEEKYAERMANIIASSPRWEPAMLGGKAVSTADNTLVLTFTRTSSLENMKYLVEASAMPLFGEATTQEQSFEEFEEWVGEHLGFPYFAKNLGVNRSRVVIEATIDRFGNIVNPEVKLSPANSLSRRAKKTLMKSPKWQPAKTSAGEPTDVRAEFTFHFLNMKRKI